MTAFLQFVLATVLPILAIVAALKDLTTYTIPNWISLALGAVFLALAATAGMPLDTVGLHLLAGFAALLAGMALFALGWIGGGDAKLLAAGCLWFGWPGSQVFLLDTAMAGGACACLLLMARGQLIQAVLPMQRPWIQRLVTPGEPAPYGVAIAIGALSAFPFSELSHFVHISY
jgi:prepilin peptidase CpaA